MPMVESELAPLRDPRLAAQLAEHATSALPAWLWSADGSRILWANAVGAAIFGAANIGECVTFRFDAKGAVASQIIRLAASLPSAGEVRLERLSAFGAGFGRALTCACSRITLADDAPAILVIAAETAGPPLTLKERVRRLFPDRERTFAVFAPDGALLDATAAALARFSGAATLSALGIAAIATEALKTGSANGVARDGPVTVERFGSEAATVLAVTFAAPPRAAQAEESFSEGSEPAPGVALSPTPQPAHPPAPEEPAAERRHPLRFVWQMDADGRFIVGSDEFIELMGPRTRSAFGRLWSEVAAELNFDPENQVARAVATHETWSGIVVSWPMDDGNERLPIELSGLPVFDRDRHFRGYRGFGVCRDIAGINRLTRARQKRPIGFLAPPESPPTDDAAAGASQSPVPGAAAAADTAPRTEQPASGVTPAAANVVPFRPGMPSEPKAPSLSPVEHRAFRELAQELTARLQGGRDAPVSESGGGGLPAEEQAIPAASVMPVAGAADAVAPPVTRADAEDAQQHATLVVEPVLLERIPVGVLIYRHDSLLYANRHFLEWSGYESLDALAAAGGLSTLFAEPGAAALAESEGAQKLAIMTRGGDRFPVEGRLFTVPWRGASALALVLKSGEAEERQRASALALGFAEQEIGRLKAMLDAAADGVVALDRDGRIVAATGGAEALFGRTADELNGRSLGELFAPESERAARDYFDRFALAPTVRAEALEVTARGRDGSANPLLMTLAHINGDRFCAVFRDAAPWKKVEEDMRAAKRETHQAVAAKADFLARVGHEVRTPLNAITGFAEVIMAERFGPISNERYRDYLKDIHAAGTHLASLLNDLLDLSKIENGQLDLTFANVNLNEVTQQCVGIMQPQASRARIIIRTALTPGLPQVVADERSLRQIVLNLISNSIRFTGPGGQVIVSTAFADSGDAVLRVRDTGVGMSDKDVEAALEPFRQTATSASWGSGGTGLGLPLTKALAEANRAHFSITSAPNAGTLVEVAFPPTRVVA